MQKLLWKASFVAVAMATLISPVASAAALTDAQVSAIINLLQSFGADESVVANVQSALKPGSVPTQPAAWCHTFNTNLRLPEVGNYKANSEVKALSDALVREKVLSFSGGPIYEDDWFFTEKTASAVTAFQEKYKDEILTPNGLAHGTGFVGAATRKKLNQLYGCGSIVKPPVTFCTQEAKQCSDGSYVSRTGPNCEFTACPTTQASIKVLSPNGGEILSRKSFQTLKWSTSGISVIKSVKAYLVKSEAPYARVLSIVNMDSSLEVSKGLASWSIGRDMTPGKYKVELVINDAFSDYSDNAFDIIIPSDETSFHLISPNGGEQWAVGTMHTIQWSSANIPAGVTTVNLILKGGTLTSDIVIASPSNTGSYQWTVPNIPGNNYVITINCYASSLGEAGCNYDNSDAPFSIVSQ